MRPGLFCIRLHTPLPFCGSASPRHDDATTMSHHVGMVFDIFYIHRIKIMFCKHYFNQFPKILGEIKSVFGSLHVLKQGLSQASNPVVSTDIFCWAHDSNTTNCCWLTEAYAAPRLDWEADITPIICSCAQRAQRNQLLPALKTETDGPSAYLRLGAELHVLHPLTVALELSQRLSLHPVVELHGLLQGLDPLLQVHLIADFTLVLRQTGSTRLILTSFF